MKRRKFILTLMGTAAAGLSGCKPSVAGDGSLLRRPGGAPLAKVSRTAPALGTSVRLTVYHPVAGQAEVALDRAFAALERVEGVMSLYRGDSQLSILNRDGVLEAPHHDLVEVLAAARDLAERSGGAFDVTVQPLWKVHHEASLAGRSPSAGEIARARARIDWRAVELGADRIRLGNPGMAVTLNGIAQGFAADVVKRALAEAGIDHALIDTGEIQTLGEHVAKDRWTIGIKHPRRAGEMLALAGLRDRSLATSGDYETTFDPDFRRHHLLDARTGESPLEFSSVTVVAPTGLQADALSTAVFLLGPEAGRRLIEASPGVDALFVTKSGAVSQTPGFPLLS
jgi:FAD:protein FMN transferase